jgi:hypothetical protein
MHNLRCVQPQCQLHLRAVHSIRSKETLASESWLCNHYISSGGNSYIKTFKIRSSLYSLFRFDLFKVLQSPNNPCGCVEFKIVIQIIVHPMNQPYISQFTNIITRPTTLRYVFCTNQHIYKTKSSS